MIVNVLFSEVSKSRDGVREGKAHLALAFFFSLMSEKDINISIKIR